MSDNLDMTPQLTLTPEADTAAAAAPAAPEAPALTLEPAAADPADEAAAQKERDAHAVKLDESQLTEAERKMVDEFSQKIDITDSSVVLQYGPPGPAGPGGGAYGPPALLRQGPQFRPGLADGAGLDELAPFLAQCQADALAEGRVVLHDEDLMHEISPLIC